MSAFAADQPERLLVWQIYWINGTLTSNDYLAKVYSAVYQLLGRGDDSAVIVVYTGKDRSDSAEKALTSFLSTNYGAIDVIFHQAEECRRVTGVDPSDPEVIEAHARTIEFMFLGNSIDTAT